MKQMITGSILVSLISSLALVGCRTAGPSTTKDIGGSPADVSKASYVVFLTTADSKVHKGACPSTNMPVNRSCPGLKDLSQLSKTDYETDLRRAILATRPGGAPSTPANPALVKTLEDKIARINSKLSAGGVSDAEKKALKSQLADLNRQLHSAIGPALTAEEQNRHDLIMQKLTASDDVTVDEGETNYQLALAPFRGGLLPIPFVKIPAGTFTMGSPGDEAGRYDDEGPQHQVTISKAFEMQTTEVTQSQWAAVMGSNPSGFQKSENCPGEFTTFNNIPMCPNNPVEQVSWDDAQAFISKLNAKSDGYQYRLPTEAEWEYATRAGTTGAYAGDLDAMAWYGKNSGSMPHPVGERQANAWGLFDMHGNVMEWTADWWKGDYSAAQVTDPVGPSWGMGRVYRGGGWDSTAQFCRSAHRSPYAPFNHHNTLGFRLLRASPSVTLPPAPDWSDVTVAGTGAASCNGSPENCTKRDNKTGLMWSRMARNELYWDDAIKYCNDLTHNGASDWRLPTREELREAYLNNIKSQISANWITYDMESWFWSASSVSSSDFPSAWLFKPTYGGMTPNITTTNHSVACVR